jgi:hypothetical protein
MADQLLSQADVDALVLSLTRSEPVSEPVPVKAPAASINSHSTTAVINKAPSVPIKPAAPPTKPQAPVFKSTQSIISPRPVAPVSNTKPAVNTHPVQKSEVSTDMLNALNAKISSLDEQLSQMKTKIKYFENIEKKVIDLEKKLEKFQQSPALLPRIDQLNDEFKKISLNLKGTPGYGIRYKYVCEKCHDHGHVAEMFRCTKCGHERWYGWWPEK